ncbi:hypothetical protein PCA20602_04250 [Pandoraea capi]|uniref:Uncharacterized protein n=1 Tax=Pandoraea capi TaxID=2508286 RepID=A0ABY6W9G1_9BURK|nr:hypothetical protein [Pandoraea capi]VVE42795.1 hypothetical protein PCA20602_04250 [Pandoraea capi]
MNRKLSVEIDRSTWPGPGIRPLFPKSFTGGSSSYDLNIPAMLMVIGYLTTPTSSTGVSLSEFWAWVRYLAAISNEPHISLTRSFSELDAHQKTILSDDFGMGVPMLWLFDKLSLTAVVDGRYFMQRIAASVGATQKRTAKRGPNKTPDFVARDVAGRWHVIECKGTQSGPEYSLKQLGAKGLVLSGGVAQKRSIQFPKGHTGQRLVCGLDIDVEGGRTGVLRIVDPEPEDPFEIAASQLILAEDAANRGVMSKALRLAGFDITAGAVASPFGRRPDATRAKSSRAERVRQEEAAMRDQSSRDELRDKVDHPNVFNGQFRGRETLIELPRGVWVGEQHVKQVIIRQGVNRDALAALEEQPTVEDLVDGERAPWAKLMGRSIIESDGMVATMKIGDVFRSEMILQERNG